MTLEQVRYRPAYDRAPVTHYLYFLADPRTPRRARYVGVTKDPARRARNHSRAFGGSMEFQQWKRGLREEGLAPLMFVLSVYPTLADGIAAEWRLMARWRRRGCDLLSRVVAMTDEDTYLTWAEARVACQRTMRAA